MAVSDISDINDKILSLCSVCGISSEEVRFAKEMLSNKSSVPEDSFICEGLWCAGKLMQSGIRVTHFYVSADAINGGKLTPADKELILRMAKYAESSYSISSKACAKISDRDGADFCFMIASKPLCTLNTMPLSDDMLIMILDGQEQPGNIGAILRSLDCAGGSGAILTNRRVRPYHSRMVRSSLGSAFLMPLADASMEETGEWLIKNNFKAVLTDLTATKSYYEADYSGRIAIIAGNEHSGISDYWRGLPVAEPVIIPMFGTCESLNVGFASTLVAYEAGLYKRGFRRSL